MSIGKSEDNPIVLKPFERRVFAMSHDILKSHWALIQLKKSKFPVATRDIIVKRISYLVGKNVIQMKDLNQIKNDLKAQYIREGIKV